MTDKDWQDLLNGHNEPPETPRERIWQGIASRRPRPVPAPSRRPWRLWPLAAAMAAVLVLGVGIGRWTRAPHPAGPAPTVAEHTAAVDQTPLFYRNSANRLFERADALLTDFRIEGCRNDELVPTTRWARSMLLQTRLLQGSPLNQDPELALLLSDLELILTQIVTIDPEQCDRDVAWIRDGLDERATLGRLRNASARADAQDPI